MRATPALVRRSSLVSFASLASLASVASLACSVWACGGRIEAEESGAVTTPGTTSPPEPAPPTNRTAAPQAAGLFVPDDEYCARASRNASTSAGDLRPRSNVEDVAVVAVSVAQECSGLGGEYLLARDLHGPQKYWLGGHGCGATKLLSKLNGAFGVVRYMSTSSVLTIPAHVCVSFPGEDPDQPLVTPTKIRAIALFETQADAEAFASSVRVGR